MADLILRDYGPMQVLVARSDAGADALRPFRKAAFGLYFSPETGEPDGLVFDLADRKSSDACYDAIAYAKASELTIIEER